MKSKIKTQEAIWGIIGGIIVLLLVVVFFYMIFLSPAKEGEQQALLKQCLVQAREKHNKCFDDIMNAITREAERRDKEVKEIDPELLFKIQEETEEFCTREFERARDLCIIMFD